MPTKIMGVHWEPTVRGKIKFSNIENRLEDAVNKEGRREKGGGRLDVLIKFSKGYVKS